MLVLLDGKGLEAALPNVPAATVVSMIAPHVRREQPLHPTAEVAVAMRPEHQMEMVGHQHVTKNPQRQPLVRLRHQVGSRKAA